MSNKATTLEGLSRAVLIEFAHVFGKVDGQAEDEIVTALAASKVPLIDFLDQLRRDELKTLCRRFDLDDSGREKNVLIDRLLGSKKGLDRTVSVTQTRKNGSKPMIADDQQHRPQPTVHHRPYLMHGCDSNYLAKAGE